MAAEQSILKRMAQWPRRRRPELFLGVRVTVAGVVAFALVHVSGLPQGAWAVFTAILVTQASLGGSLKATIDRLIGTVGGAMYGAAIATLVPHTNTLALGIALALSLAPLAVLGAIDARFRVAPITAVILLVGYAGTQEGPVLAAVFRMLEVALGGVVGLVVSLIVLPARANAAAFASADQVLNLLATLFADVIHALTKPDGDRARSAAHRRIRATFDRLELAADEADRERRALLSAEESDPTPLPRTLRRLYHDIIVIGRVAVEPLRDVAAENLGPALAQLAQEGGNFLRDTGETLRHRRPPPPLSAFEDALAQVLVQISAREEAERGNAAESGRLVALGFALEQLRGDVRDLAARAQDFVRVDRRTGGS